MRNRFDVLDSFRGISAIFVVIFHMHFIGSITEISFFRNSKLFVEFFFILSGFVLTHSYSFKDNLNFKSFFLGRTLRLFPLHIVILVMFILLEFGKLYINTNYNINFNNEPFTGSKTIDSILPNMLLLQSWIPNVNDLSWNYPSWSISIEYYMYMIFFITLLFKRNIKFLISISIFCITFLFVLMDIEVGRDITRGLSSFFSGTFMYLIYKSIYKSRFYHKVKSKLFVLTIVEILMIFMIINIISINIENKSILILLAFNLLIFIFAFEGGYVSIILKKKVFLFLGKLSYSIYMIHALILFLFISILTVVQKIYNIKLIYMDDTTRYIDFGCSFCNNIAILLLVIIIMFISHFTYIYIEQKGKNLLHEKRKSKKI